MRKSLLSFALLAFLLASCGKSSSLPSSSIPSSWTSSSEDSGISIPVSSIDTNSWPSEPINDVTTLDFYAINDFHGAVEYLPSSDEPGITRLGTYFGQEKAKNPDGNVILSAGDMWQGSADSNITHGALVTECMNQIGFAAMEIGNHEFDWTDSYIYANRELADFPFLGGNIIDRSSGKTADFADAYTMIERQGVRIGIIGVIGSTLESSILASAVANYDFVGVDSIIKQSADILREQGSDVIVLLDHNDAVPSSVLPYVDVVFNGHSHEVQNQMISGVPNMQAGSNGQGVSHVELSYDKVADKVTVVSHDVDQDLANRGLSEDSAVKAIYDQYYESQIKNVKEEVVGTLTANMSKPQLGNMAVAEMLSFGSAAGAQVAFHNTGGVRSSIPSGSVTYGEIYAALPFDNNLVLCTLTGTELLYWLSNSDYIAGANASSKTLSTGEKIVATGTYKAIAISYLTEKTDQYPHNAGLEIKYDTFVRDLIRLKFLAAGSINPSDYNYL